MYAGSSLSEAQRAEAVALFEPGYGYEAVASCLRKAVMRLGICTTGDGFVEVGL
jgi:hypothetical protein